MKDQGSKLEGKPRRERESKRIPWGWKQVKGTAGLRQMETEVNAGWNPMMPPQEK